MQTIQQNEKQLNDFLVKGASFGGESDQSERSLMEMAYSVLVDRARPLMRDPFRLGFEVVYSNEDSTKMVGIFIFRVGKNIFYIPVFYRNGKVRGLHTIYDCRRKKVKPLTTEWCERLVAMSVHRDGRQVDRNLKNQYGTGGTFQSYDNLRNTRLAGGTIKVASVTTAEKVLEGEPFNWMDALKITDNGYVPGESLRKVASAIGYPAAKALRDSAAQSEDFLAGLAALTGDVPAFFKSLDFSKKASAQSDPLLEIIPTSHKDFSKAASELPEDALTEASVRGWTVVDRRPLDKRAAILGQLPDGEIVNDPGCYDVVFDDGEVRKCFALLHHGYNTPLKCARDEYYGCDTPNCDGAPPIAEFLLIDKDGNFAGPSERIYSTGKGGDPYEEFDCSREMSPKNLYAVVNTNSTSVEGFFYCKSVDTDGAVKTYTGRLNTKCPSSIYSDGFLEEKLIQNPEAKESLPGKGMLGKDYMFVKIALKSEKDEKMSKEACCDVMEGGCCDSESSRLKVSKIEAKPVDAFARNIALLGKTVKKEIPAGIYSIAKDKFSKSFTVSFDSIEPKMHDGGWLNKNASELVDVHHRTKVGRFDTPDAAAAALMLHSGLSWDDSIAFCKQAGKNSILVKRASLTEQPGLPTWTTSHNPVHNVAIEQLEKYVIPVDSPEYQPDDILSSRLGDREGLQDTPNLLIAAPTELFEFSRANDVKSLFEHDAVKQLVKTYDVGNMIDSYLPDLENAVDRLGRILILLHWKPAEVSEIYGVEDTVTLEDTLLSGFLNLGEIFLELDTKIRGGSEADG